jgi:hypothetical protein
MKTKRAGTRNIPQGNGASGQGPGTAVVGPLKRLDILKGRGAEMFARLFS